jgi:hypothetical protein
MLHAIYLSAGLSYAGAAAARLGWHLNDQGNCYAKPDQAQCDTEPAPVIIFHAALFQNTADTVLTSNGKGCSSTFFDEIRGNICDMEKPRPRSAGLLRFHGGTVTGRGSPSPLK